MKTLFTGLFLTIGMVVVANFLFGPAIAAGAFIGGLYATISALLNPDKTEVKP